MSYTNSGKKMGRPRLIFDSEEDRIAHKKAINKRKCDKYWNKNKEKIRAHNRVKQTEYRKKKKEEAVAWKKSQEEKKEAIAV